jgi:spore maturation protein CgeB
MSYKILIIGYTSQVYDVGSAFVRSAKELNLSVSVSNIQNYQISMQKFWGKLIYRINDKRTLEWWKFNHDTQELIEQFEPEIILVTGLISLSEEIFKISQKINARIVNYLTDDPWNPYMCSQRFIKTLPLYNSIFSTKKAIIPDLIKNQVQKVEFLPFAFDPWLHHIDDNIAKKDIPDICFIGTADQQRQKFFQNFPQKITGKLGLYGAGWDKINHLQAYSKYFLYGDAYCQVIKQCKINIGLVRRANRDGHAMRSYEIPACGGVGIYEDTPEHRQLFSNYPEYGFFTSPEELAEKCNFLIKSLDEREKMRFLGHQVVATNINTYTHRLRTIIELLK